MLSNQTLQQVLEGLKGITNMDFVLLDTEGKPVATTGEDIVDNRESNEFKINDGKSEKYCLKVFGAGENARILGEMAAFQIQAILSAHADHFSEEAFVKSLLMDNLLLVDIYNRARQLDIDVEQKRAVVLIECPGAEETEVDAMRRILNAGRDAFLTAVDEKNHVLIKHIGENESYPELERYARDLMDKLEKAGKGDCRIACGTIVGELMEVSKSYKEAEMALDVAKTFFPERKVVVFNTLGIGRLIYQMPFHMCTMFIEEVFGENYPEKFDEETLITINKFFENSLNVSETARQLYIHRNTLVYRLDKIQKLTGLDLRVFEDAITFKIALMVAKHMKHMETMEY